MPFIVTSRNTSFRVPSPGDRRIFVPREGYENQMYGAIVPAISTLQNLAPRTRSNPTIRGETSRSNVSIAAVQSTPFGVGTSTASDIIFNTTTAPPASGSTLLVMGVVGAVTDILQTSGRSLSAVYADNDGTVSASIINSSSVSTAATSAANLYSAGSLLVIVGTFITGTSVAVYLNGIRVATSAGTWNGTSISSGSFGLSVFGGAGLAGLMALGWYRALSNTEILDISTNWPQLFQTAPPARTYSLPLTLYSAIDEASPSVRTDYVTASAAGSLYTFTTAPIVQPLSGTSIEVNYDAATSVEASMKLEFVESTNNWGVFLPKRWLQQPQGVMRIDSRHPLASNAVAALLPSMPYNIATTEPVVITGSISVVTTSTPTTGVPVGISRVWTNTATGASLRIASKQPVFTGLTVGGLVAGNGADSGMMSCMSDFTTQGYKFYTGNNATPGKFRARISSSSTWTETGDINQNTSRLTHITATWLSGGILILYFDSVIVGASAALGGSITPTAVLNIFGGAAANHQWALMYTFNRALTSGEVYNLYRNPWQIFSPAPTPTAYFFPRTITVKNISTSTDGTGTLTITPSEYAAVKSWPWTPTVRLTST